MQPGHRPDLDTTLSAFARRRDSGCPLYCFVEIPAFQDVIPGKRFLRLRERAIGHGESQSRPSVQASSTWCGLPAFGTHFHNITTQAPFEVWMAIGIKARLPRVAYPKLHIVRFSDKLLTFGVTEEMTATPSDPRHRPPRKARFYGGRDDRNLP
jgi:hypothetical protein